MWSQTSPQSLFKNESSPQNLNKHQSWSLTASEYPEIRSWRYGLVVIIVCISTITTTQPRLCRIIMSLCQAFCNPTHNRVGTICFALPCNMHCKARWAKSLGQVCRVYRKVWDNWLVSHLAHPPLFQRSQLGLLTNLCMQLHCLNW